MPMPDRLLTRRLGIDGHQRQAHFDQFLAVLVMVQLEQLVDLSYVSQSVLGSCMGGTGKGRR